MNHSPRSGAIALLVLAVVAGACQSTLAPPMASPAGPPVAASPPGSPQPLEAGFPDAGTYTNAVFEPSLTLTLDDGWQVFFADDVDEMALEGDAGDATMLVVTRVSHVVDPRNGRAVDAPDDLVAWLQAHPSLVVDPPSDTTVDGRPAKAIDATTGSRPEVNVFAFPTGNFHIPPRVRLRLTVVPMDGPDLVISMGGPIDRFDAAIARTDTILTSLRIGDQP